MHGQKSVDLRNKNSAFRHGIAKWPAHQQPGADAIRKTVPSCRQATNGLSIRVCIALDQELGAEESLEGCKLAPVEQVAARGGIDGLYTCPAIDNLFRLGTRVAEVTQILCNEAGH